MKDPPTYSWEPYYLSAALETNDALMPTRIYEALAAIEQRRLSGIETDGIEDRAMEHAQTGLLTLKAERTANGNTLESADLIRVGPLSEETC